MRLLWDVTRCRGVGCERKLECLRHQQMENMGPRTPHVANACAVGDSFIEIARKSEELRAIADKLDSLNGVKG